jgi:hypothetical protein
MKTKKLLTGANPGAEIPSAKHNYDDAELKAKGKGAGG